MKRNKKKRIAMIGHKRIPSREGGVEIVVDELSTRLVEKGYEVDAYNRAGYHVSGKEFDEKRGRVYNGIRLITIPTFKSSKLNAIVYSFLATVRALFGHYDVIHYHAEGPCAMLWIPKLFGIRVVATIHGLDWQRAKWGNFASKVLKFGELMAAKYADEVIVLSENVKKYFQETYHRDVAYIPNGINRPEIRGTEVISEKFGLEKDGYLLFLARLVPEKGIHYLIRAFRKIDTDKKLVIAGGNSHAMDYVDKIRKMAAKDERVIFTGFVQGEELEELYSNCYLFVLPSDVEGMSISLLEAMSYGNCCLVSDIKENIEVVGEHAPTFKAGSVESLHHELLRLMKDEGRTKRFKEGSAEFICRRFDWDVVTDRTLGVYFGE